MILSYPTPLYVPTSIDVHSSTLLQNANKVDEFNYRLSRDLFIGTYDNIEVTPGLILTITDFVTLDDLEMTTTHSDLNLFQLSFCIEGQMKWSYKKMESSSRSVLELSKVRSGMASFKNAPVKY